jgi:hypothetical protein
MKFIISRARGGKGKPHEDAFLSEHEVWDTRYCSEEFFNTDLARNGRLWRSQGTKHKVTGNGHISRMTGKKELWTIEIPTLDDLVKFMKQNERIILEDDPGTYVTPMLTIYDDYIE